MKQVIKIAILAMGALFVIMKMIHKHYDTVARELARSEDGDDIVLPSRNHAVVLVKSALTPGFPCMVAPLPARF